MRVAILVMNGAGLSHGLDWAPHHPRVLGSGCRDLLRPRGSGSRDPIPLLPSQDLGTLCAGVGARTTLHTQSSM